MKSIYKRKAYLLDEDILIEGYTAKGKFYPNYGVQCGFSYQIIRKKDIGKEVFYSKEQIDAAGLSNLEIVR